MVNCWVFTSRSKFHGCQADPKFYYREARIVGRAQQRKTEHMSHLRTKYWYVPTYSYTEWKLIWMGGFYNASRCQPYLCYLLLDQEIFGKLPEKIVFSILFTGQGAWWRTHLFQHICSIKFSRLPFPSGFFPICQTDVNTHQVRQLFVVTCTPRQKKSRANFRRFRLQKL